MLIARAVASACLTVLKWMLWLVAALLLALMVSQHLRGEAGQPLVQLLGAGIATVAGWLCGHLAGRFEQGG